jgi:hypothetical protein
VPEVLASGARCEHLRGVISALLRRAHGRGFSVPLTGGFAVFVALASVGLPACDDDTENGAVGAVGAVGGAAGAANVGGSAGSSASLGGAAGAENAGEGGGAGTTAFCGTDGVSKGPWVVAQTETSARIRWESCVPGRNQASASPEAGGASTEALAVESSYEITSDYKTVLPALPHDLPGTWYLHEATVEGLAPSTCYRYEVAGQADATGRFCTARAPGEAMTFLAIGDTNPGLGDSTKNVLAQVLPSNPDFTLHQGDLQYYSSSLETYASWFPLMAPLLRQGAMLPAVGNHESEKPDEFEGYYQRFFGGSGEGAGTGKTYYRFTNGGLHFFSLDTEQSLKEGSEQAAWLVAELAAAQKQPGFRGSIVWMHRPFATCGDTGQLAEERAYLAPSLEAFGVRLVLCGHVHGYERFRLGNLDYVVTGGGGGLKDTGNENIDRPECASRVATAAAYHAVVLRVENGQIGGTAIDAKGNVADTFSIPLP